jgi:hypothetical protein
MIDTFDMNNIDEASQYVDNADILENEECDNLP